MVINITHSHKLNTVFSILGKLINTPEKFMIIGTGFFIDEFGVFVTAGHVFRNHQSSIHEFFICFPSGEVYVELIPINNYRFFSKKQYLDNERHRNLPRPWKEYQCGPEYFDVALGKVVLKNTPFYEFKKKRPYECDKLNMPCYNINKKLCPNKKFELKDNLLNSQLIEFHNWNLEIKERLRLARIPYLYEGMVFENIDKYNNCIEVYGKGERGNSGAPVIDNNGKVIGIYIAGTTFSDLRAVHLSKYVVKKVRKLKKFILLG